jgi:putative membrane protein
MAKRKHLPVHVNFSIFAMVSALRDHRQILKRIQGEHYTYISTKTAEKIGLALLLMGLISFIGVPLRAIS